MATFRNHPMNRTVVAVLLAFALMFSAAAQAFAATNSAPSASLSAEEVEAFLDSFFTSPEAEPHYAGASVVVVQGNEVIAQKGYGYANLAEQTEADPENTVFRLASVSKTFTAVAIMQLAEQGKINLSDDIAAYLGGIEYENPFDTPVTVAQLLTHRSGFEVRDPKPEDIHEDLNSYVSMEEYIKANMPPVVREPGTAYMYDNFAYLLLGYIVQNVSGEPFEQYMERHIFNPLGMENSTFELKEPWIGRLATLYDPAGEPLPTYGIYPTIMPHGGMLATAADVGKFMIAMLNGGKTKDGAILSESSVREMLQYRYAIHPLLPETTYGFEAAPQMPAAGSSAEIVTKAGDLIGNSSYLLLLPEQRTGVFLTYNKQGGVLRDLFFERFVNRFFPGYAAPADLESFQPDSADELAKFSGLYADLRLSSLVTAVSVAGDGLLGITDALIGPRTLRQVDENLFVDNLTQRYTAFELDADGKVTYMNDPYLNPMGYARRADDPVGFKDVPETHPFAKYILSLQSLNVYPNEPGLAFEPEQPVTRAELVRKLLEISRLPGSAAKEYGFSDIDGHPDAAYIQAALELGMIRGDGKGRFEPDRAATRQEAAVMIWNVYRMLFPDELFQDVELAGSTAEWAVPAVRMMVALGLHGPEVQFDAEGKADFRSLEPLRQQEAAALYYQLLLQPVNQIAAQRSAQTRES